jgi:pyruvate carboxylase
MSPTGRWRLTPTPSSEHPGDAAVTVDLADQVDVSPRHGIRIGRVGLPDADGRRIVEVVVDGWRHEFFVEDADRAALRERATRDRDHAGRAGGPLEIRAIIPGRIATVAVTAGDPVAAGQTLLSLEAMKMHNELRAPRAGVVGRVPAVLGSTVDVGDLLVVLE